jgi:hypothetical protein
MPSIFIPPEPPEKVFALAMPDDMLRKLGWEIAGLRRALSASIETGAEPHAPAYHAFNCAVTAWHMTDWVWQSGSSVDRGYLLSKLAVPATSKDFGAFTRALMDQHRVLHICRQIAVGSKHKIIERRPDPDVGAEEHRDIEPALGGTPGIPFSHYSIRLLIRDGKVLRPALEIFEEAEQTWYRLLREWGYFEAEMLGMETR